MSGGRIRAGPAGGSGPRARAAAGPGRSGRACGGPRTGPAGADPGRNRGSGPVCPRGAAGGVDPVSIGFRFGGDPRAPAGPQRAPAAFSGLAPAPESSAFAGVWRFCQVLYVRPPRFRPRRAGCPGRVPARGRGGRGWPGRRRRAQTGRRTRGAGHGAPGARELCFPCLATEPTPGQRPGSGPRPGRADGFRDPLDRSGPGVWQDRHRGSRGRSLRRAPWPRSPSMSRFRHHGSRIGGSYHSSDTSWSRALPKRSANGKAIRIRDQARFVDQ